MHFSKGQPAAEFVRFYRKCGGVRGGHPVSGGIDFYDSDASVVSGFSAIRWKKA